MKRIIILFLLSVFLVSIAGCVSKTEYDKLSEEQKALEKRCEQLVSKETELRNEIVAKKKEVTNLRSELKNVKGKIRDLEKSKADLENKIAELERSEIE